MSEQRWGPLGSGHRGRGQTRHDPPGVFAHMCPSALVQLAYRTSTGDRRGWASTWASGSRETLDRAHSEDWTTFAP